MQSRRESADRAAGARLPFGEGAGLCHRDITVEVSSKISTVDCQCCYPSPRAWPDPARIGPFLMDVAPTPLQTIRRGPSAPGGVKRCVARESLPCAISTKVARIVSSGAMISGDYSCQTSSSFLVFSQPLLCSQPAARLMQSGLQPVPSSAARSLQSPAKASSTVRLSAALQALSAARSLRRIRSASDLIRPEGRTIIGPPGGNPRRPFSSRKPD